GLGFLRLSLFAQPHDGGALVAPVWTRLLHRPALSPGSMGGGQLGAQSLGAGFSGASPGSAALAGRSEVWTGALEFVAGLDFRRGAVVRRGNLALQQRDSRPRRGRQVRLLEFDRVPVSRMAGGNVRTTASQRSPTGLRCYGDVAV